MRPHSGPELRAAIDGSAAAPADDVLGGGFPSAFSRAVADSRERQLEAAWKALLDQLREPVDSILRGSLSTEDVAYRLGELVHAHYCNHGTTLTSFELRRIVVALLDNCRGGLPLPAGPSRGVASPGVAAPVMAATVAGIDPAADGGRTLVAFTDRSDAVAGPRAGWNDERPLPAPVLMPDLPSSLVSMTPRSDSGRTTGMLTVPVDGTPPGRARTDSRDDCDRQYCASSPAAGAGFDDDAALAAILPALERRCGAAPETQAQRDEAMRWLRRAVAAAAETHRIVLPEAEREGLERRAFDELFGLGPLEALLRDDTVSAVFVNAPGAVFAERDGRLVPTAVVLGGARKLDVIAERLARRAGVSLAASGNSVIDRQLEDGTRVTIVSSALAPAGPCLVIRRPPTQDVTLDTLAAAGMISVQVARVLKVAVHGRLNILVCGMLAAGKTTVLAALARAAAGDERVVTIEAGASLRPGSPHHVSLITGGEAGIGPMDALSAALALRPDRLVIDGASDAMLPGIVDATVAGMDGVMVSITDGTPQDALGILRTALGDANADPARLRRRLSRAFDLMVHVERPRHGIRQAVHVADLAVAGDTVVSRDLFAFDRAGGHAAATGLQPSVLGRLRHAGLDRAFARALQAGGGMNDAARR